MDFPFATKIVFETYIFLFFFYLEFTQVGDPVFAFSKIFVIVFKGHYEILVTKKRSFAAISLFRAHTGNSALMAYFLQPFVKTC